MLAHLKTKKNTISNALFHHCTDAWVTRPERTKGAKDEVKPARRAAAKRASSVVNIKSSLSKKFICNMSKSILLWGNNVINTNLNKTFMCHPSNLFSEWCVEIQNLFVASQNPPRMAFSFEKLFWRSEKIFLSPQFLFIQTLLIKWESSSKPIFKSKLLQSTSKTGRW